MKTTADTDFLSESIFYSLLSWSSWKWGIKSEMLNYVEFYGRITSDSECLMKLIWSNRHVFIYF